jgi:hypothetical protein
MSESRFQVCSSAVRSNLQTAMPAETEIEAMMCACSRKAVGVVPSNMRCHCSSWSCFKHFLNSVVIDIINLVQTKRPFLFPLCLNQPTAPITTFINETLIIIMNYKIPPFTCLLTPNRCNCQQNSCAFPTRSAGQGWHRVFVGKVPTVGRKSARAS